MSVARRTARRADLKEGGRRRRLGGGRHVGSAEPFELARHARGFGGCRGLAAASVLVGGPDPALRCVGSLPPRARRSRQGSASSSARNAAMSSSARVYFSRSSACAIARLVAAMVNTPASRLDSTALPAPISPAAIVASITRPCRRSARWARSCARFRSRSRSLRGSCNPRSLQLLRR